jgi:hypothetical protein
MPNLSINSHVYTTWLTSATIISSSDLVNKVIMAYCIDTHLGSALFRCDQMSIRFEGSQGGCDV